MNQSIWKYPLEITDNQTVVAPTGAVPLSVQMQGDTPCLWMLVRPEAKMRRHHVRIHGTGHNVSELTTPQQFVGTFQVADLVFHCFYLGEPL